MMAVFGHGPASKSLMKDTRGIFCVKRGSILTETVMFAGRQWLLVQKLNLSIGTRTFLRVLLMTGGIYGGHKCLNEIGRWTTGGHMCGPVLRSECTEIYGFPSGIDYQSQDTKDVLGKPTH